MCGLLSTCPPSTAGEKWGGMGGLSAGEVCSGCVGLCGARLGAKLEGREGNGTLHLPQPSSFERPGPTRSVGALRACKEAAKPAQPQPDASEPALF